MNKILILLALVVGSLLISLRYATDSEVIDNNENELPRRRSLQRAAWNSDTWLVVYNANTEEEATQYQALLQTLEGVKARGIQVKVMPLEKVADSLLHSYPIILIGTQFPEIVYQGLNDLPDIAIGSEGLNIGDLQLKETEDFAQLTYLPSPWSEQLPMYLIWGKDSKHLLAHLSDRLAAGLRSFLWSSWGYEVIRENKIHCLGYFNDSTWLMDKKTHFEFSPHPSLLMEHSAASFWTFDGAEPTSFDWIDQLDTAKTAIQDWSNKADLSPLQLYFYPSVERKALSTGSMEQVHYDKKKMQVHLVSNDHFSGEEWGEHYLPWLQEAFGASNPAIEQGLGLQWIDEVRGQPWHNWVYRLAMADALPPLSMLYDDEQLATEMPVIGRLAAGAWVDYCIQTVGRAQFLISYKAGKPPIAANSRTEKAWKNWILQNYQLAFPAKKTMPAQRLNGFTLAHEGYRIFNGYGGSKARQSLEGLANIGVDAVAIVPYSFMRNSRKATPIPVARRAGSENDEAGLFSHFSAQQLGQFTLLKPQIWLGGGSWPGDVTFATEAEWEEFFTYYRRWIMHYALQAEMYGWDALCIGTELRYTTLQQPQSWKTLIADIRKVYSGTLTYAANWGEECEQITFWQDLDFIGVNSYYPLHKEENATTEELLAGAERVIARIEKIHQANDRPVWLTEVGYRSATAPWLSPHSEAEDREIAEQDQARCYEALFTAAEKADWLKGFFWWKWPSILEYDENNGRGYMPLGKPAEDVIRKYYLKENN